MGIFENGVFARRAPTSLLYVGRTVRVGEAIAFAQPKERGRRCQRTILDGAFTGDHNVEAGRSLDLREGIGAS